MRCQSGYWLRLQSSEDLTGDSRICFQEDSVTRLLAGPSAPARWEGACASPVCEEVPAQPRQGLQPTLGPRWVPPVQKESGELVPAKPHGPCGQGGGLKEASASTHREEGEDWMPSENLPGAREQVSEAREPGGCPRRL